MNKFSRLFFLILLLTTAVFSLSGQINVPPAEVRAEVIGGGTSENPIVRIIYNFPEGYHQTFQKDFFYVSIISPNTASLGEISYPAAPDAGEEYSFYGETILEAELLGWDPEKDTELRLKAAWQLCDEEGTCFFPESDTVTAELKVVQAGSVPVNIRTGNLLIFLLMAFLGGLLLNVMPCVLPVLSIKALSLVKQGGENRRQILSSSMLYTAGVVMSLLVLAIIIIIIKASGQQVGWGFQFQNRNFVLVLLTIIFVFALSLFEVFTISAPVMRRGPAIGKKSHAGSHFFSGIIAVLLATPCTAPFLGTAAGFAFSQPPAVIIAIFIMIGLGLAFPFILIGFFPAIVSRLPKPGAWMNTFREVMGFLLIGTSVWLIDVLMYQSSPAYLTRILIYLTAVTVALWLYGKLSGPGATTRKRLTGLALAVIIIALTARIVLAGGSPAVDDPKQVIGKSDSGYAGWQEFSPDAVRSAAGGDRPVFVAFSAKWCMTCRTNERAVIFTKDISRFFEESGAVLIHGDFTNKNPEINKWMADFGRAGVPFYSWYPAGSDKAVLLPEIITKSMITELEISSADDR
ncbi:MAG: thioredoxin family protein [Spirochaetales bacterium]|nr:thioredoxin family protein [Spirochaetales bacterium]